MRSVQGWLTVSWPRSWTSPVQAVVMVAQLLSGSLLVILNTSTLLTSLVMVSRAVRSIWPSVSMLGHQKQERLRKLLIKKYET